MWPFRRKKPEAVRELKDVASFGGDLEDGTRLRHHAVRALCGVLMDRHAACRSPHPFCGIRGHSKNRETPQLLIADTIPQRSPISSGRADIIGIYLSRATAAEGTEEEEDVMKFITLMSPFEAVPHRKLVVYAPQNGTYQVMYGPILNPVEGDYSTGSIDPANARQLDGNPEPRHCRWRYWDSELPQKSSSGEWFVPRFHCMQVFGEWWIVEMRSGLAQQVAALDFTDNPEHNFGIHERKGIYVRRADDESEYSKVVRENLPLT